MTPTFILEEGCDNFVDRSPPVLRWCELKSCRLFVGEQPNLGRPLCQPVSPIQDRGRKPEAGSTSQVVI